jgi:hypothetical protein
VAAPYTQLAGAAASVEADLKSVAAAAQAHGAAEAKTATTNLVKDILKAKAAAEIITTKLGTT